MAAQGERGSGAVVMCSLVDDPMAQDEIPEQDIVVEELELPPTNGPKARNGRGSGRGHGV